MSLRKKPGLTISSATVEQPTGKPFFSLSTQAMVTQNQSIMLDANGLKNAKVPIPFSDLTEVKVLGNGSFGVVYLVKDKTGQEFALKEIRITEDPEVQKNIYRELHSYLDYAHKHIVQTFNVYFLDGMKVNVLLELCKYGSAKDLQKRLKSQKFNENCIGILAIDILRALVYVHNKKIIHRDIKPDNILIAENGDCKLADFGVATSVLVHDENQAQQTFAGSISYMAPERIQSETYTESSDIWSLGVSFVELLMGRFPYGELKDIWNAINLVVKGPAPLLNENMGYSKYCVEFINAMLEKDVSQRVNAQQLLDMTFCKMYLKKEGELRQKFAKWIKDNI
ncbi:Kinase, STE STE7 [Spironucleus salmonicida]|uniref:mitogen-activated protein kinase kinase n=1 Tax=Spironucleus salmonicida TaxID=348837 RepID=V6LK51_9EUKA|nr:Kinase, STE STE7 [Spironucleus salmonicida]|eukprot:EST45000.1 Kinase, STE STE7 [Spironucleus salmonicida]